MIVYRKIFLLISLILFFSSNSFSQFRYFVKLFEEHDKKYIQLFEENKNKKFLISQVEDEQAYKNYEKELKEEEKTEYTVGSNFKSKKEFLTSQSKSDFLLSLQEDSRRKIKEDLSKIKNGGVETAKVKPGAFKNVKDQKFISKSYGERSSLNSVTKLQVFISIPETNTEFKNIFNSENFKNNQYENAKKIKHAIKKEANPNVHFTETADLFTKTISNTIDNKPIVLIGHNEKSEFRFSDGSRKKFEKIDSSADVANRCIIYLSCNASQFTKNPATSYFLTYNDGIAITNRINNTLLKDMSLKTNSERFKKEVISIIDAYGKEKKQKIKYKMITYWVAISGAGYTLYEIKHADK